MGAQASKGSARPSSSVHLRGKKDLAGVGVIFRKNHEGFLIVKDLVGGSAADQSGLIEPGDILTQVDDVKVAKASIAEISSLVLGEPGQQVKLKFVRMVGKAKKKYKVILQRTVRASLEPTYHVQRDGVNTKVTHIHLDCLQDQDLSKGARVEESHARDVLDADGNVVGPGLIQRAKAAKEQEVFGVERIDASHPAWPGNNLKRNVVAQGNLNQDVQVTKTTSEKKKKKSKMSEGSGSDNSVQTPVPSLSNMYMKEEEQMWTYGIKEEKAAGVEAIKEEVSCPVPDDPVSSLLDSFMKSNDPFNDPFTPPAATSVLDSSTQEIFTESPRQGTTMFIAPERSFADEMRSKSPPVVEPPPPIVEPPPPVIEPPPPIVNPASILHPLPAKEEEDDVPEAVVTVEDAEEADTPDWEGLAQSRVLVFEAKSRENKAAKPKKVDLEKEWAKTAAKQSSDPPPVVKDFSSSDSGGPAAAGGAGGNSSGAPSSSSSAREVPEPPVKEEKKPLKPVAKKTSPRASDAPKKIGGKGDLAALMAARKKQMDEADDEGYYF
mmetsp:Transcript_26631/g.60776  ORF Transcript_26631/g.60776 Transcript_26631/m.60776 type:complete len:549 (-) Transcript_26631:474-2120(-)